MESVIEAVVVLGIGLILGWFAARQAYRGAASREQSELRSSAAKLEAALESERAERARVEERLQAESARASQASGDLARAQERLEQGERLIAEQRGFVEEVQKEMEHRFQALAAGVLQGNTQQFMELADAKWKQAREQAAGDLEARQKRIDDLVAPLAESLKKLETQTGALEKERHGAYQGLLENLSSLREATSNLHDQTTGLTRALKGGSQARGRWGEVALRNIVDMAGMTEHCDFVEQTQVADGSRPDMIVKLPGQRFIALDAKAPMNAYMAATETQDQEQKERHFKAHARSLRSHVRDLASREYAGKVAGDVDLVVLFLPADPFLSAAFTYEPELQNEALRNKVLIATPTTLLALLRTVAIYWEQRALAENAEHIAETAKELYARAALFGEHLDKTGKGLQNAVEAYNEAVASFRSRFLPMGQRLAELKAVEHSKRALEAPREVDAAPRDVPTQVHLDF